MPEETTPLDAEVTPEEQPAEQTGDQLIMDKYKTVDDLVNAHKELEKKLGELTKPAPETVKISETPAESINDLIAKAGFKPEDVLAHYAEHNDLSDEHYDALKEKAGVGKTLVQNYMKAEKAAQAQAAQEADAYRREVVGIVDGEDNYRALISWAQGNLSADEIAAYDASVDSGNPHQARLAVEALHNRYLKAVGADGSGNIITGDTPAPSGGGVPQTLDDWSKLRDKFIAGKATDADKRALLNAPDELTTSLRG